MELKAKLESKCSFVLLLLGSWAILSLITLRNRYLRGHNHNYHLCISLNRLHFHCALSWLWIRPVKIVIVPIYTWTDFEETIYEEINHLPIFFCNIHREPSKSRELEALSACKCILCERTSLFHSSTLFFYPLMRSFLLLRISSVFLNVFQIHVSHPQGKLHLFKSHSVHLWLEDYSLSCPFNTDKPFSSIMN